MYTKAEKEQQKMLYIITSVGLLFSSLIRNLIHNAFYKYVASPQGGVSDYFFSALETVLGLFIPAVAILIYNSTCNNELKRCKIPLYYMFYERGVSVASSLISTTAICAVSFVLVSSGHLGKELVPYDNHNYIVPAFSYIPYFLLELMFNALFWVVYFKKQDEKNALGAGGEKPHGTAKEASVRALLATLFTAGGYYIFYYIYSSLYLRIFDKISLAKGYTEYCFYSSLFGVSRPAFLLVGVTLGYLLYNLISKNRKEYKAPIIGITYIFATSEFVGLISNLTAGIDSLVKKIVPFSIDFEFISVIILVLSFISVVAVSFLLWNALFKHRLNVHKNAVSQNAPQNAYIQQGAPLPPASQYMPNQQFAQVMPPDNFRSNKSRGVAAVLCFFFGTLGVHRFYVGKIGTGLLWLCTLGFFGIGDIVDFIMIICGSFKDSDGRKL